MLVLISMTGPTSVDEAISDDGWIIVMQEELNQFQKMMYVIWYSKFHRRTLLSKMGI